MKKFISTILAAILTVSLTACGGGGDSQTQSASNQQVSGANGSPQDLTFGAATVGGTWYTLAGAMGEEIKKVNPGTHVTIVEGGSISNLKGLEAGKFHIGFSNGESVLLALEGKGSFEKKAENISSIATLYPNVMQIVVRADSDIRTIEDLKGKKVSPGIKGYSGEVLFEDILKLHNMGYEDLARVEYVGMADGANLLRDGHIDAIVGMISAPASTFQELDTTLGIRIIPIPDEDVVKLQEANSGFSPFVISGGTYTQIKDDIKTIAAPTVLLVNKSLNDEIVYQITKTVIENNKKWSDLNATMKDFNGQYSVEYIIGQLHPGAEKYYKEAGFIE